MRRREPLETPATPTRWRRGGWNAAGLVIGLIAVALCYGPMLLRHARRALVQGVVNDDSRVWVTPFLRLRDAALFRDDLLNDYALACLGTGYRLLFELGARLVDPFAFAAGLSYALLLGFLIGLACAAARFGGVLAGLAAVSLGLGLDAFLSRMGGGTARAFGFTIFACGLAALVHGRLRALALIVVLGALFYAPPALPLGVALAVVALGLGPRWRGELAGWSFGRRLRLVAVTALLSVAGLLPTAVATRAYGPYLTPGDVAAYPERGVHGRFMRVDSVPFPSLAEAVVFETDRMLRLAPGARPWVFPLLAFAGLVLVLGGRRDPAVVRLAICAAVVVLGFHVSGWVAPWAYLPQRYVRYPMPVLAIVALLAAASLLVRRAPAPRLAAAGAAAALLLWMVLGPRGDARAGLSVSPQRTAVERYLAGLPPDVLVAGWPTDMDNVPWRTRRRALLTYEHHMPFQRGYADAMRARTEALLAAYFATDTAPLRALRTDSGATHLVVDVRHFGAAPPRYFAPFDAQIAARRAAVPPAAFVLPTLRDRAVFSAGPRFVLDLGRL